MNILDKIVAFKKKEVEERRSLFPVKLLERSLFFAGQPVSLKKYVTRPDKSGIIAEIKRKSPSKGMINPYVSIERTSIGYMQAGASALSILTDKEFFGGSNEDLSTARKFNFCPILRKEFIIDEYQVVEAKSIGADAILLIAAILEPGPLKSLANLACSLGMETLIEVHDHAELENAMAAEPALIGVNNRNLKTFEVNLERSVQLALHIDDRFVKVAESGIESPDVIVELRKHGYQGFLIGQTFMQHSRPEEAARSFIRELRRKTGEAHA